MAISSRVETSACWLTEFLDCQPMINPFDSYFGAWLKVKPRIRKLRSNTQREKKELLAAVAINQSPIHLAVLVSTLQYIKIINLAMENPDFSVGFPRFPRKSHDYIQPSSHPAVQVSTRGIPRVPSHLVDHRDSRAL